MQDLLTYLRNNDSRIKEIEKDEKTSLSNATGDLLTRLKDKENELDNASDERKRVINIEIQSIKNDIEIEKDQTKSLYSVKKLNIQKDSFDKILNYAQGIKEDITDTISTKEDELKTIKNNIFKANDSNNFELVKELSEKAHGVNSNIINYKNVLDDVNNLTNDIENTMNKMGDLTFEGIDAILKGYKSNIMEIEILLGHANEKTDKSNNIEKTGIKKKEEPKALEDDDKEIKEKIAKINELLKKAETEKDEKALSDAIDLINTLSDGEDKSKLQAKADEIKEKLKKKPEEVIAVQEAEKAIEIAFKKEKKEDIKKAYDLIEKIKDASKKEELTKKLDDIVKNITSNFTIRLNNLMNRFKENKFAKVKREEVVQLVNDFDNLYKEEILEINFSKKEVAKDVKGVVLRYNSTKQKEYQENKEVEVDKKGKIKKIFNAFKRFIELRPLISGTKLLAKFFKTRLAKNVQKGNEEKVKKYEKRIKEMDIINSVTMFRKKNDIAKMSPKLYKNGVKGLDDKEKEKYTIDQNVISSIMLKQLLKKTDEDVYKDKLRVKTVIGQWLDLYSRIGNDDIIVSDTLKRESIAYSRKDVYDKICDFLVDARYAGTISKEQYEAYLDEMLNIGFYKRGYDDFYEIPSVKYEDDSYYDELKDKEEYYENPVVYKDVDKDNEEYEQPIPYIKK